VGRETLKVDTTPRRVGLPRPGTGTGSTARCSRDQTGNQTIDVRGIHRLRRGTRGLEKGSKPWFAFCKSISNRTAIVTNQNLFVIKIVSWWPLWKRRRQKSSIRQKKKDM
jgi:hypothetical protein